MRILAIILLCGACLLVSSTVIQIENEVLGEPTIDCQVDSIVVQIRTRRPFYGRLFVKGHSSNSQCLVDFAARSLGPLRDNNATIRVQYGTCDVRRERSVSPGGVRGVHMYSSIIVQFHSIFITKVDRSYRLSCFYKEAVTTVGNSLEVSQLTTANLDGNFAMPVCTYSLRQETPNGPLIKYSKIGDRIVHRWDCQSPGIEGKDNPYGMLVHSCVVDDGRGNNVPVVDEHGCSIDVYILDNLVYSDDLLMAYQGAEVFKFADQNALVFSCQIRLCVKAAGACEGLTKPKCPPLKNKRSVQMDETTTLAPLASAPQVEAHLVVHNWTASGEKGAGKITAEKVVCFNGAMDCLLCQYDMQSEEPQTDKGSTVSVVHSWHCRSAIPNAFHRHHSLFVHSCSVSEPGNADRPLIDENGCELNTAEVHDLAYENGTVMAFGELTRGHASRTLTCQLRLCSRTETECQVKLSKCKKRVQRSGREFVSDSDSGEDVDVSTERLLVFDTDDLQGISIDDFVTRPISNSMCLGYVNAVTLVGLTILLFLIMITSCLIAISRWRHRGDSDPRLVFSSAMKYGHKLDFDGR